MYSLVSQWMIILTIAVIHFRNFSTEITEDVRGTLIASGKDYDMKNVNYEGTEYYSELNMSSHRYSNNLYDDYMSSA